MGTNQRLAQMELNLRRDMFDVLHYTYESARERTEEKTGERFIGRWVLCSVLTAHIRTRRAEQKSEGDIFSWRI